MQKEIVSFTVHHIVPRYGRGGMEFFSKRADPCEGLFPVADICRPRSVRRCFLYDEAEPVAKAFSALFEALARCWGQGFFLNGALQPVARALSVRRSVAAAVRAGRGTRRPGRKKRATLCPFSGNGHHEGRRDQRFQIGIVPCASSSM